MIGKIIAVVVVAAVVYIVVINAKINMGLGANHNSKEISKPIEK